MASSKGEAGARLVLRGGLALCTALLLAGVLVSCAAAQGDPISSPEADDGLGLDTPVIVAAVLFVALVVVVVAVSIVRKAVRLLLVAAIAVIVLSACGCVIAMVWSYLS